MDAEAMVARAARTETTVSAAFDETLACALGALAAQTDTWTGLDGREYVAFHGEHDAWRVVLVGRAYAQPARYR